MFHLHRHWTITAVPDVGGYLRVPRYEIVIEDTNRVLTTTADAEVSTVPEFIGTSKQL